MVTIEQIRNIIEKNRKHISTTKALESNAELANLAQLINAYNNTVAVLSKYLNRENFAANRKELIELTKKI